MPFCDESSIAVLLDFGLWSAIGIVQVTFAKLVLPKILAIRKVFVMGNI